MKPKAKHITALILALVLALSLAACGGSNKSQDSAGSTAYYDNTNYELKGETTEGFVDEAPASEGGEPFRPQDRKLITTVTMQGETRDFDSFLTWLETQVNQVGGYVESSELYTYDYRDRSSDMTLRIPADKLNGFLQEVGGNCNILQKSIQEDDVTLDYVDAESYRDALLVEQERLLELLEQADNLEDIMSIEDRLTSVRYQLQNYESTLRVFNNQINYSTVHLSIREVAELTEPEPESWGSRAWAGMVDNAKEIGVFFQELGLFLVTHLPTIAILALIVAIVLICTAKPRRQARARRRQQKDLIQAMRQNAAQSIEPSGDDKKE